MTWIFIHITFATRKKIFLIVEMSLPKLRTYQQTFELYLVSQGTCPPTQNTTGRSFVTKGKWHRQQDGLRGQGVCIWTPRTGSDQPLNRVCQFLRGWLNFLMCTAGNENQTPRNPRKMPGTFQAIGWLRFTMFNMTEVAPARGGKCHQECDSGGTAVGRTLRCSTALAWAPKSNGRESTCWDLERTFGWDCLLLSPRQAHGSSSLRTKTGRQESSVWWLRFSSSVHSTGLGV